MTSEKPAPVSRRERPAKPALTREGIVRTAMDLMRAEGLERVTMRRLAQELDTGAASLYVYVRNTAELRAYMLDDLLARLDLSPVTAEGDWRDRLVTLLWSYTVVLMEYPGLAQSALVTRPTGPGYLALVDGLLALLVAEVPADRAAWAVDLLLHFAHIAGLGMELVSGEGPDRLTWGFHVLINGIRQTPRSNNWLPASAAGENE
jgi:AcrR family transcriptional regulator